MATPVPESALNGPCSVIHKDTLYVYTPDAFQSIRLAEGEKWSQLPMGVSATGAACVYATSKQGSPLLYVVGGTSNKPIQEHSGLQSYSFDDRKWTSIPMANPIAANRTNHAATYLSDSSMLFVFSGSQKGPDDKTPSMETFVIDTLQNHRSLAIDKGLTTRVAPQLVNWNTSHALLVGGSDAKDMFLFEPNFRHPDRQWTKLDVTLPNPVPDRGKVKVALINGADGSKVLEIFDLNAIPNIVSRIALLQADGKPVSPGQTVGDPVHRRRHQRRSSSPPPAKRRRRDINLANWPAYNSSLAPSTSRTSFAIAQDPKGMVVIAGGDEKSPLILFDTEHNSWLNATEFFNGKASVQSVTATTTSTTPTSATAGATVSLTESSVAATPTDTDAAMVKSKSLKILGGALGGVFGLAVLLAFILVLLRWCRKRKAFAEAGHQRRSSGMERLSFADRGISYGSDAGIFMYRSPGNKLSTTSIAIMNGRIEQQPPQKRGLFSKGRIHSGSSSLFSRVRGRSPIGNEMQMQEKPGVAFAPSPVMDGKARSGTADGSGKQRSSGWSRYWSGQSTTNLAQIERNNNRGSDESHAHLTSNGAPQPLGRSPSEHTLKAQDDRSYSRPPPLDRRDTSSTISTVSKDDAFSSGVPASVTEHTAWTPIVGQSGWSGDQRVASSVYTDSVRGSAIARDDISFALPREQQPPVVSPSTFPRQGPAISVSNTNGEGGEFGAAAHTDMSWLNLGAAR